MTMQSDERARDFSREDFQVEGRTVRPRLGRIVFRGETVQVQPKIMELLVCLARHRGEVVTRAELIAEVWGGAHVTEHAIARAVCGLRKIFGDSAQAPRVVETIPKIGYRLVAPVTAVSARESAARDDAAAPAPHAAATEPTAAGHAAATAPSAAPVGRGRSNAHLVVAAAAFAVLLFLLTLALLPGGGHRAHHFIMHRAGH